METNRDVRKRGVEDGSGRLSRAQKTECEAAPREPRGRVLQAEKSKHKGRDEGEGAQEALLPPLLSAAVDSDRTG